MARNLRRSKPRKTNPLFVVFCEGETEERYVSLLRQTLKVAVRVKSKLQKNSITIRKVTQCIGDYSFNKSTDTIVLFYDKDNEAMNQKLQTIESELESKGFKVLGIWSNPVVELWYLLHFEDVNGAINGDEVLRRLKKYWNKYQKGKLAVTEINELNSNVEAAINRAKKLVTGKNPSSLIFQLIEKLK